MVPDVLTVNEDKETVGTLVTDTVPPVLNVTESPLEGGPPAGVQFVAVLQAPDVPPFHV